MERRDFIQGFGALLTALGLGKSLEAAKPAPRVEPQDISKYVQNLELVQSEPNPEWDKVVTGLKEQEIEIHGLWADNHTPTLFDAIAYLAG